MPTETENPIPATPETDSQPDSTPKPQTSELRAAASRANGAKSRGPKTPAGKARSSRNALRHGLTAKSLILKDESARAFLTFLASFDTEFQPRTEIERDLVVTMAQARWRATRTWKIENAVLDDSMEFIVRQRGTAMDFVECQGLAFRRLADHSQVLGMIDRNENRYERHYNRAFRALLAHRAYRAEAAQTAVA